VTKPTVLVVDDDEDIVEAVTLALDGEGYRAIHATGHAALRCAEEARPDVVLMDVMMPLLDGTKLSRLLRANPRTAHIPIVAMSALSHKDAPHEMRYDAWLGKPFDLLNLLVVINAVAANGTTAAST
jgi:CheY-like chemotaxis protein